MSVYLSVPSQNTHFRSLWRSLVKKTYSYYWPVMTQFKNVCFATKKILLCCYRHRLRDLVSPICGIFLSHLILVSLWVNIWLLVCGLNFVEHAFYVFVCLLQSLQRGIMSDNIFYWSCFLWFFFLWLYNLLISFEGFIWPFLNALKSHILQSYVTPSWYEWICKG